MDRRTRAAGRASLRAGLVVPDDQLMQGVVVALVPGPRVLVFREVSAAIISMEGLGVVAHGFGHFADGGAVAGGVEPGHAGFGVDTGADVALAACALVGGFGGVFFVVAVFEPA